MTHPSPPTIFERVDAAKMDQLRQAQSAGATVSQLKTIADDFDKSIVQGATNDIGNYVFESEDPYQTYLDISNAQNQTYQQLQVQSGQQLPQSIINALGIMANVEDRQKAIEHARKAWTMRDEDRRIGERKQAEAIALDIKIQKSRFNSLLLDFSNMDADEFLEKSEVILDELEFLGEPNILELREKIVTGQVGGEKTVFNPRSDSTTVSILEERITTDDPTLDLGDLNSMALLGKISYGDFKRFSGDITDLMDANLQEALADYRPGLLEGMTIFSGQGNEEINNYTNFKRAAGKAQRKAIRNMEEFDPFAWADENHASFMENEAESAEDTLLSDLEPFTSNTNIGGLKALQRAIVEAVELEGDDGAQTQRLRELQQRAQAHITSGKTIANWSD